MTTLFDLAEHTIDMIPGQPHHFAIGMTVRINGNQHKDDYRDGVVTGIDADGVVVAKFQRKRPHPATQEKTILYPVHDPSDPNYEWHNPVLAWKHGQ